MKHLTIQNYLLIFFSVTSVFLASNCFATEWVLLEEDPVIKVYARQTTPPSFKAQADVAGNLLDFLAVLSDIPDRKNWVKNLIDTTIVAGDIGSKVVLHSLFDMPWPAQNRDSVIESIVKHDLAAESIEVQFKSIAHPLVQPSSKLIRIPYIKGAFSLKKINKKNIRIDYHIQLDPGGWLPSWIVNHFVKKSPKQTLKSLIRRVEETRGQHRLFIKSYEQKIRKHHDRGKE